ncbi:hypothetical protein CCP2SC5_40043 [Azospirillaceae bacterium]
MRKSILFWLGLITIAGGMVFNTSYRVQGLEEQLAVLKRKITSEHEAIQVLKAEWSFLNEPTRLEQLVGQHLPLRLTGNYQFAAIDAIPMRPLDENGRPVMVRNVQPAPGGPGVGCVNGKPSRSQTTTPQVGARSNAASGASAGGAGSTAGCPSAPVVASSAAATKSGAASSTTVATAAGAAGSRRGNVAAVSTPALPRPVVVGVGSPFNLAASRAANLVNPAVVPPGNGPATPRPVITAPRTGHNYSASNIASHGVAPNSHGAASSGGVRSSSTSVNVRAGGASQTARSSGGDVTSSATRSVTTGGRPTMEARPIDLLRTNDRRLPDQTAAPSTSGDQMGVFVNRQAGGTR